MPTPDTVTSARERELSEFIGGFVAEIQPLELKHNEAFWLANTTGEARYEEESARLDAAMRKMFARREPGALLLVAGLAGRVREPEGFIVLELSLIHI